MARITPVLPAGGRCGALRSVQAQLAQRLVGGRPGVESVGQPLADLDRVYELHGGLDALPPDALEPDQDSHPLGAFGDPLGDHLDPLPGLVEFAPPAPDPLLTPVHRLEAGKDAARVVLDLWVTDREQRLEVVLVPGAVAAFGQLGER